MEPEPAAYPVSNDQLAWFQQMIQEAIRDQVQPLQEEVARLGSQRPPTNVAATTTSSPDTPLAEVVPPLQEQPPLQALAQPKRKLLPDPPKFSGNRSDYATWSQQMRDKIRIDGPLIDDCEQVWYLINSCLATKPQHTVATFYASGGPGGRRDPADFMTYLDRNYKDRNIQKQAAASLQKLMQGDNVAFSTFLPVFEQRISEAGGANWDDSVKITFLEGALNSQLRRSLVTVDLPTNFFEWLHRVQEIAWKVENLEARTHRPRHGHTAQHPGKKRDAEGDTTMTGINRVQGAPKNAQDRAARPPRPNRRHRCYVCASQDHLARDCPDRHAESRVAAIKPPARSKEAADELQDSYDGSSDGASENE